MRNDATWYWVVLLIYCLVFVLPIALIVRKSGRSAWWVLTLFIPLANILFLWLFALTSWPALEKDEAGH
ncbi:hypothetical protein [Bordetella genomosp. 1]|uniref:DUF805 domain-containing protein n=1 Tax=Bordetella genomosp. 1 TaxID=1395607 RepID=A0ABX4EUG9_9BORD|nr:hypothetical protein [Bordetella genomosp. 1]OZI57884.1 hypothetical protein CAL27_21030 [Bordetella genomosp. 1]